jgi:hypothetical protein
MSKDSVVSSVLNRFKDTIERKYLKTHTSTPLIQQGGGASSASIQKLRNIAEHRGGDGASDNIDRFFKEQEKINDRLEDERKKQESIALQKIEERKNKELARITESVSEEEKKKITDKYDKVKENLVKPSDASDQSTTSLSENKEETKQTSTPDDKSETTTESTDEIIQPTKEEEKQDTTSETELSSTPTTVNTTPDSAEPSSDVEPAIQPVVTTEVSAPVTPPVSLPATQPVTPQVTASNAKPATAVPKAAVSIPYVPAVRTKPIIQNIGFIPDNPMKKDLGIKATSPIIPGQIPEYESKKGFQSLDTATYKDPNQVPTMTTTPNITPPPPPTPEEPDDNSRTVFRVSVAALLCQAAYSIYYLIK